MPVTELTNLAVTATTSFSTRTLEDDRPRAQITVDINYSWSPTNDGGCAVLDESFGGEVNGIPFTGKELGHLLENGGCAKPFLTTDEFALPADGEPLSLVISDTSGTIRATFADRRLEAPTATPMSHEGWEFAAGDKVTIAWSDEADLETLPEVTLFDSLPTTAGAAKVSIEAVTSPGPGLLEFELPDQLAFTGDVFVELKFLPYREPATECTGGPEVCEHIQLPYFVHTARVERASL